MLSLRPRQVLFLVLILICPCLTLVVFPEHGASAGTCETSLARSSRAAELRSAIMAAPTVAAYDALGSLYVKANETTCAISAFRAALKINPRSKEANYDLAMAFRMSHQPQAAEALLRSLVRDYPDFALADEALGEILAESNHPTAATQEFQAALRSDRRLSQASYGLAELSISQKRPKAAIYWIERALSMNPDTATEYKLRLTLGIAEVEAGDFNKAVETLRQVVASHPKASDPHLDLGTAYAHLERYREAAEEYGRVLQLDRNNNPARLAMAQAYLRAGDPAAALPLAIEYATRIPHDAEGFFTEGRAYQAIGQFPHAIEAYWLSLKVTPGDYRVLLHLGECQLQVGQKQNALQSFEAAEQADKSAPAVHYQIFRILLNDKQPSRQLRARRELAEFKDLQDRQRQADSVTAIGAQANDELSHGNPRAAADLYSKMIQIKPTDSKTHYNLSLALAGLGDRVGEKRELHAAVVLDPTMGAAYNRLGLLDLYEGKLEGAENNFRAAIDNDPGSTEALTNLATVYGKLGRTAEAKSLYREVIAAKPNLLQAELNLGLILAEDGNLQQAISPLMIATRLAPSDPTAFTALGIVQGKLGHSKESIAAFEHALSLNPNSTEAHLNLGIALADGSNLPAAAAQFAEAERLSPSAAIVHYNAGRVAFDMGDDKTARQELEIACERQPNYAGPLELLAQVDIRERSPEQAIARLEQVLRIEPHDSNAQYLLGKTLESVGKKNEAIALWKSALKDSPNDQRLYWEIYRALPPSDPEAKEYLARMQAVQYRQHEADRAKALANSAMKAASSHDWGEAIGKMDGALKVCSGCPLEASLQQNLGLIYAEQGDLTKAERALRRSVEIDPKLSQAQAELQTIEKLRNKLLTDGGNYE